MSMEDEVVDDPNKKVPYTDDDVEMTADGKYKCFCCPYVSNICRFMVVWHISNSHPKFVHVSKNVDFIKTKNFYDIIDLETDSPGIFKCVSCPFTSYPATAVMDHISLMHPELVYKPRFADHENSEDVQWTWTDREDCNPYKISLRAPPSPIIRLARRPKKRIEEDNLKMKENENTENSLKRKAADDYLFATDESVCSKRNCINCADDLNLNDHHSEQFFSDFSSNIGTEESAADIHNKPENAKTVGISTVNVNQNRMLNDHADIGDRTLEIDDTKKSTGQVEMDVTGAVGSNCEIETESMEDPMLNIVIDEVDDNDGVNFRNYERSGLDVQILNFQYNMAESINSNVYSDEKHSTSLKNYGNSWDVSAEKNIFVNERNRNMEATSVNEERRIDREFKRKIKLRQDLQNAIELLKEKDALIEKFKEEKQQFFNDLTYLKNENSKLRDILERNDKENMMLLLKLRDEEESRRIKLREKTASTLSEVKKQLAIEREKVTGLELTIADKEAQLDASKLTKEELYKKMDEAKIELEKCRKLNALREKAEKLKKEDEFEVLRVKKLQEAMENAEKERIERSKEMEEVQAELSVFEN